MEDQDEKMEEKESIELDKVKRNIKSNTYIMKKKIFNLN